MSDALPLPPRPNLEQYKKLAKELLQAGNSGEPDGIRHWASRWPQHAERLLNKIAKNHPSGTPWTLSQAQFFLAREHGFASWPKFSKHLTALALAGSPVSNFEAAADAIVSGDIPTLTKLLRENPDLITARSTREHRSTLLHYISANGIEDFRQKTPQNIIEIARILLDAGADVNSESDAYGGHSMTLGLTATSWHPEKARVQLALMDFLISRGAIIDAPNAVNSCLHNGRGEAAEFLAARGARLDLEGAAGVGRLDIVEGFFDANGSVKSPATTEQMRDGFAWACEFGRTSVVEFLLDKGIDLSTELRHNGQTGLHWAALHAEVDTVKMLLRRGASVSATDKTFGTTPLGWALHAWTNEPGTRPAVNYYQVIALLVAAGATVQPTWLADRKVRGDPKLLAALTGEMPDRA